VLKLDAPALADAESPSDVETKWKLESELPSADDASWWSNAGVEVIVDR
jgi:hypothetical protein